MRNNDLRLIVDTFKYYYISITKNESFRFKMTKSRKTVIEDFIKVIKSESNTTFVQKDYLKLYMEYQFNYWYKQDAKYGQGASIQIEWIIGKKAYKRWQDRSDKQKKSSSYFVRENLKKDVKLKLDKEINKGWADSLTEINPIEEFEKEMFHNTAKGLINCSVNTTLYNHKSNLCLKCKFKAKCKKELKIQYPNIYKLRGY